MNIRLFLFLCAALCAGSTLAASAAPTPAPTASPIVLPTMPPSAGPWAGPAVQILQQVINGQIQRSHNTSSGTVSYFRRYDMQLTTGGNAYRDVHLHQGTVINPRGWSLKPGDRVAVSGTGQPDGSLNADVITVQQ